MVARKKGYSKGSDTNMGYREEEGQSFLIYGGAGSIIMVGSGKREGVEATGIRRWRVNKQSTLCRLERMQEEYIMDAGKRQNTTRGYKLPPDYRRYI